MPLQVDPALPPEPSPPASTRVTSPEGILKSGAVLTRAGTFLYTRAELGLDAEGDTDDVIEIERTIETLSHPTTLSTLRSAPITSGHPPEGVTAENFRKLVVGYVASEPRVVGDVVIADDVPPACAAAARGAAAPQRRSASTRRRPHTGGPADASGRETGRCPPIPHPPARP